MMASPLARLLRPFSGIGDPWEDGIFAAGPAPFLYEAPPRTRAHLPDLRPEVHEPLPVAPTDAEPAIDDPILIVPPSLHQPPTSPPILVEGLGMGAIRITGTSRSDLLAGGPGDDRLDGGAGDDIFLGGPGRDLLYGGAGHDTIRYDRLRTEVSLDTRFQRIGLEDGEDQYDSIEIIDLRDGDWILTAADPAALVQRLWLAATGHAPSAAEMIRETTALATGGTPEALATRLGSGTSETVQSRLQAALDAPREGRLDQPVWLPDAEALTLSRLCVLALGCIPERDAFLRGLDALEGGQSVEALAKELLETPLGLAFAPQADAHALALSAQNWML